MDSGFFAAGDGFDLRIAGLTVLRHRISCPAVSIARGAPAVTMRHGNFRIEDAPVDRIDGGALTLDERTVTLDGNARLAFDPASLTLTVTALAPAADRIWLRLHAEPDEQVWGGGEQMSYLALRGRRFPMWTSEPGVGRDKSTELTRIMDAQGMAGGDFWTTNYPQPTFLSSRNYACHLDGTTYSALDFTAEDRHEIEVWSGEVRLEFFTGGSPADLVGQLATRFGLQPPRPEWAIGFFGAVLVGGVVGGALQIEKVSRLVSERASVSQSYDVGPEGRFGGQEKAMGLILQNPLGIGAGQFALVHHHEEPHNVYLSMPLNAGWMGAGLYNVAVALTLLTGFAACMRRSPAQRLLQIAVAAFAANAFEGVIIDTDHWRHFYVLMALVWGIATSPVGEAVSGYGTWRGREAVTA